MVLSVNLILFCVTIKVRISTAIHPSQSLCLYWQKCMFTSLIIYDTYNSRYLLTSPLTLVNSLGDRDQQASAT